MTYGKHEPMLRRFAGNVRAVLMILVVLRPSMAVGADWITVGGDRGNMRYSKLAKITRENVNALEVAWVYHTGELNRVPQKIIECTPIIADGVMYITTGHLRVVALNAATGDEVWQFDPFLNGGLAFPLASGGVNRGVAYWSDGEPNGERRILFGSASGHLYSLDAATGELGRQILAQVE